MKHQYLPIRDLCIEIDIDHAAQLVTLIVDRIDSSLIISCLQRIERDEPIRLIDNVSHSQFGRAIIENMYAIKVKVFGLELDCACTQLAKMSEKAAPEFTLTLREK